MDNIIQDIPLIIFATIFTIALFVFIIGGIVYLVFRDPEKKASGKRALIRSIYWFFAFILLALVYFGLTWFLNQDSQPATHAGGEFPMSPVSDNFPPAPKTITIAGIDFNGPFLLDNVIYNEIKDQRVIFLIFCKKGEDYDIIYMGDMDRGKAYKKYKLLEHQEYPCWLNSCQDYMDLYVAIYYLNPETGGLIKPELQETLSNIFEPLCPATQ